MSHSTTKILFSHFMPTKIEEKANNATKVPYKIIQTLVEVRDFYPPPTLGPLHPWTIKHLITPCDADTGCILIPSLDAFNHVFRYWTMEMTEPVVFEGKRQGVMVQDVTDENNSVTYYNEEVFMDQDIGSEFYVLSCEELARTRQLKSGEEVGIYWDIEKATFLFKVFDHAV